LLTLLDLCVSSLRRSHADLPHIVPILADDPRRESSEALWILTAAAKGRLQLELLWMHLNLKGAVWQREEASRVNGGNLTRCATDETGLISSLWYLPNIDGARTDARSVAMAPVRPRDLQRCQHLQVILVVYCSVYCCFSASRLRSILQVLVLAIACRRQASRCRGDDRDTLYGRVTILAIYCLGKTQLYVFEQMIHFA